MRLPICPLPAARPVGDACVSWGSLLLRPTGLTISLADAGRVQQLVDNWAAGQPQVSSERARAHEACVKHRTNGTKPPA